MTSFLLLPSGAFAQRDGDSEIQVRDRLAGQVGLKAATKLLERFGASAEDSYDIETGLKLILVRKNSEVDFDRLNGAMDRVASQSVDGITERERRQLAASWFLIYEVTRRLEGNSAVALEQLRIASDLDPSEESYSRELALQDKKRNEISRRLELARKVRNGESVPDAHVNVLKGGANQ